MAVLLQPNLCINLVTSPTSRTHHFGIFNGIESGIFIEKEDLGGEK